MSAETVTVPIFPLPNIVFFPETVLPLHIFEPRYKEMIAAALEENSPLGVVQLKPGWDQNYYGNPPVYRLLGVGEIVSSHRWDDGRYDIILAGKHRARIVEESQRGQYRMAQVEYLEDITPTAKTPDLEENYSALRQLFDQIVASLPEAAQAIRPEAWTDPSPGVLADLLAHTLVDNAYDKQSILAELDVARRLALVRVQMNSVMKPNL
ncbi:MAG: LON peptidase substrate-binding domain-containing protein [Candidatus Sumerlaeaceae bacterium]|nr:LON peptidase substrate-binding domain-containing protein [Candidatus Sumerlaeaceae bacterium]